MSLLRGEVRAREEGLLVGGEEDVQRPATLACHRLAGLHTDRIDVGTLLAVDLHAHEGLVHERRGLLILCPGKCLGAPRVPVDRVLPVLQQVGGGLAGEPVHRLHNTLA
jgi:hypothetical protein